MIAQLNYEPQRDAAMDVIVSLKKTLDKYKEKDDANQKYVSRREEDLVKLVRYIKTSEAFYLELIEQSKEAYNNGFRKGMAAAEKSPAPHPMNKEAYRSYLINESKREWHDHF